MIKRAREVLKFIFYFKIQDHKVVKFQGKYVGRHPFQDFVPSIAPHIPDVEFVINMIDEPRVLKRHQCNPSTKDWAKCSCDKGY